MDYKTLKGTKGESLVADILSELGTGFKVRNNVIWLLGQIDHIVVCKPHHRKIVFVIETKNWSGKITGASNCRKWQQTICGNVNEMYNPIMQNAKHCKLLKWRYPFARIINTVVFIDGCQVRRRKNLIFSSELLDYIKASV